MKASIKKAWVKALRSGEYKQATGTLCKTDVEEKVIEGWCCIGVLCNLRQVPGRWDDGEYRYGKLADADVMPQNLRKRIGLSDKNHDKLVNMNDAHESFKKIAHWIEENL